MTRALTQALVDTVAQYPILGIVAVLVVLLLLFSADQRRWSAERRRRRLTDRIASEDQAVRALEVDARRRSWYWPWGHWDEGKASGAAEPPPESPP